MAASLTREEVNELLDYDPETGFFRWKKTMTGRAVDGIGHHIGYFDSPEAAHEAYLKKKREIHIACTV